MADTDMLLSLARESGGVIEAHEAPGWEVTYVTFSTNTLAALEQRIRQQERNRAAAICEHFANLLDEHNFRHAAAAIRSSGTSESQPEKSDE